VRIHLLVPVLALLAAGCRDQDGDGARRKQDCDDDNGDRFAGNPEVCDGMDNDCNGFIDDLAADPIEWHRDRDGDGHGNPTAVHTSCAAPPGWVAADDDCDDDDRVRFPTNEEVCDDHDNDCNGAVDDGVIVDFFEDVDADGFGNPTSIWQGCVAPPGWVEDDTDCDDTDDERNPDLVELCDELDNDCSGVVDDGVTSTFHPDRDSDGFGDIDAAWDGCEAPPGWLVDATDCDDADELAFPGNPEVCDQADNNCDGAVDEGTTTSFYGDGDGDGFGNKQQKYDGCTAPAGYITDSTDCNDAVRTDFPGNKEACDGFDNDCDGVVDNGVTTAYYADADGDQYGNDQSSVQACSRPPGFVTDSSDCNDGDYFTWPGAYDECNGVDNDCNGKIDDNGFDSDGDNIDNCNDPTVYLEDFNTCVGKSPAMASRGWTVQEYANLVCCGATAPGMPVPGTPPDREQWNWCGGELNSGNVNAGHSIIVGPDHGHLNVFSVQARVGAGGVNVDDVGIVLNYTGPGDFFLVRWDDPNNAYVRSTRMDFIRCVGGQCAILDTANPVATAGVGFTPFDVRVRYDAIDIYINGVLQMSTITNGGDIGPGRVGVYAFDADTGSRVDSLAIVQP
jgi:hypothetical protein